ncbi:MjaI family restriction endonuclease [candidate division KSB1 bacterium]|nr:MjaI family restriction endonuclease [candidate division KSB1 bacterium]
MDEFTKTIDRDKFRATNAPWNDLMLNDPWSVGYVTTLIELKPFINKEQWENFYFEMGAVRNKKLNTQSPTMIALLEDEQLIRTNREKVFALNTELREINTQHGRTREQLAKKGAILFHYVQNIGIDISLAECIECVRFRVICETWNGVIIREKNAKSLLQRYFPGIEFKKTDGAFDHRFAVDFELTKSGKPVCGIQVKPKSYTYNAPYLNKARKANQQKNARYRAIFGLNVYDVIFEKSRIINQVVIRMLRKEIDQTGHLC